MAGVLLLPLLVLAHFMMAPRRNKSHNQEPNVEDDELWRALDEQRREGPDGKRMQMATRALRGVQHGSGEDAGPTLETPTAPPRRQWLRKPRILRAVKQADTSAAPDTVQSAEPAPAPAANRAAAPAETTQVQPPPMATEAQTPEADHRTAAGVQPSQPGARVPSESDVELVQSMIKKLAHQVNAAELFDKAAASTPVAPTDQTIETVADEQGPIPTSAPEVEVIAETPASAEAAPIAAPTPPPLPVDAAPGQQQFNHPLPPSSPASPDVVQSSLDALRNTASEMRAAEAKAPDHAPQIEQPLRPATTADGTALAPNILAALGADDTGAFLEPIVTLDGMAPAHYEFSLEINTEAGSALNLDQAETIFQATEVLPAVDNHRFKTAISIAEVLSARGKSGDLLTRVFRESLMDRDFCFAVATNGVANETLARHMVLSLSQSAVHELSATEWQTLSEFHELGYRFALSHVYDLDIDFSQLTATGFAYVKLDATGLLNIAAERRSALTPERVLHDLAQAGLTVIIDGIADHDLASRFAAIGAGFGQGPVSGGPRMMKSAAIAGTSHQVA